MCYCTFKGFDIQMKGPEISSPSQPKRNIRSDFCTVQVMPASARNTTVSGLDPKSTYDFRIVPKAGRTAGEPSEQHRIGPGDMNRAHMIRNHIFIDLWR